MAMTRGTLAASFVAIAMATAPAQADVFSFALRAVAVDHGGGGLSFSGVPAELMTLDPELRPDPGVGGLPLTPPEQPLARAVFDRLMVGGDVIVADAVLHGRDLRIAYGERRFSPFWVGIDGSLDRAYAVKQALYRSFDEGLNPDDYFLATIAALIDQAHGNPGDGGGQDMATETLAALDVTLTAAVMRFGADLQGARLAPRDIDRELFDYDRPSVDRPLIAQEASAADSIDTYLMDLVPADRRYGDLRRALAAHRDLALAGGWPSVPEGPTLRPGDVDARVPALRVRLTASGDYDAAAGNVAADEAAEEIADADAGDRTGPDDTVFDDELVAAVERFQARHGLLVDGVVGPATRGALNVTVEDRIGQIIASLERRRWLDRDLGDTYLMVNIPAYRLTIVDGGAVLREMDVVVGRADRPTPLFSSALTWMEFNPTWTVPITIAQNDMLPRLIEDPAYLAEQGIRLYSDWGRDRVEMFAEDIEWTEVGRGIRRFMLRQEPGPANALGRVKFMMANSFSVYLHDTPTRNLFYRDRRAYSSGCVRVSDPMWLADHLMAEATNWPTRRDRLLSDWQTTRINLPQGVPTHLAYFTAWLDDDGTTHFREDVYGADRLIVEALAQQSAARMQVAAAP